MGIQSTDDTGRDPDNVEVMADPDPLFKRFPELSTAQIEKEAVS